MTFIIDTQIFLWAVVEPDRLSLMQKSMLQSRAHTVFLSSVSVTELMIKSSVGKLEIPFDPVETAHTIGFELLDYRGEDALFLKELPFHHKDPFDRMIITQSMAHNYPVMTVDAKFKHYPCKIIQK